MTFKYQIAGYNVGGKEEGSCSKNNTEKNWITILAVHMTGSPVFGQKLVQSMLLRIFIIVMKLGFISKPCQKEQCASRMINPQVGKRLKNV